MLIEKTRKPGFVDRIPVNIYLFRVNNGNTRKRCKICSKLTMKNLVLIVKFEHILPLFLVFLFFDFEQVNGSWDISLIQIFFFFESMIKTSYHRCNPMS